MGYLLAAALVGIAWLAWRPFYRERWRAAEAEISQRLALGSDNIVRGAESIRAGATPRAALLLHGFGDTPQSLSYLAQRLVDAGWTVSAPLLPGHGRTLHALHASRAADWLKCAREEFDALAATHRSVVVCGQSMGAALALDVAAERKIQSLALLAPYIATPFALRAAAVLWPVAQAILPVIRTLDARSIQDPAARAKSLGYGYTTPHLLAELAGLVRRANARLRDVRVATLIVHSREDNRVPVAEVQRAVTSIPYPDKSLHWVTGCGHVIAADYCRDSVATLVVDWFERVAASQDTAAHTR
jgi:carboxylesterase